MTELPSTIVTLWWAALVVTAVVVAPITVRFLHRVWMAARTIRRYGDDTRKAAEAIARNTANAAALDEVLTITGPLLQRFAALRDLA